ncbi:MAG: helix-turn-helix domain-containing protein [Paracoccaceae bacterium]
MVQDADKVFLSFDAYEISLGELLRGERATLGKNHEQVQKDLKIKVEFIEAIEKCDLTGLGNRSFIAGYVRTYARYLGLDPEQVYKRFCQESGFLSSELNPFSSVNKKNLKKKTETFPILDNKWQPGSLGSSYNQRKGAFLTLLPKIAPVAFFLVVLLGVGYWSNAIIQDLQRLEIVPTENDPYQSVNFLSDIMGQSNEISQVESHLQTLDTSTTNLEDDNFLVNYYASQEELFPIVENRDSPIAKIDPNSRGIFVKSESKPTINDAKELKNRFVSARPDYIYKPRVMISPRPPVLRLIALEKAWVRLRDEQGDIYLERNFKAGEQFKIPNHLFTGSLRAGNATKVYFELDGKIFGPLSKGNSVVKNFRLHPLDIGKELISIAEGSDLFKSYKAQQATGLSTAQRNNE